MPWAQQGPRPEPTAVEKLFAQLLAVTAKLMAPELRWNVLPCCPCVSQLFFDTCFVSVLEYSSTEPRHWLRISHPRRRKQQGPGIKPTAAEKLFASLLTASPKGMVLKRKIAAPGLVSFSYRIPSCMYLFLTSGTSWNETLLHADSRRLCKHVSVQFVDSESEPRLTKASDQDSTFIARPEKATNRTNCC